MVLRILGLLLLPATAFAQGVPTDPLIHFTFGDTFGVGQVVTDESGNLFDAWSMRDPVRATAPGFVDDSFVFDGMRDRVVLPEDAIAALSTLEAGSIFVRFSYEDLIATQGAIPILYVGVGDTSQTDNMLIIEVGHGTALDNHKLYMTWVRNGTLVLCFDTGFDLVPGQVYSFVGIVGPQGNTAWLDGAELVARHYNAGQPTTQFFFDDLPPRKLQQFTVGYGKAMDFLTEDFVHFGGAIDEVQVFDRPLSKSEATALTLPVP